MWKSVCGPDKRIFYMSRSFVKAEKFGKAIDRNDSVM